MSEGGLTDRMNSIEENMKLIREALEKKKPKKFNLLYKGVIGRRKIKAGYVLVISIGENKGISFWKEPIVDSTVKLGDTFHHVNPENIFIYKNRPAILIYKSKIEAFGKEGEEDKNETMGQKYILARMQNEAIMPKKKLGAIGGWLLIILIAVGVAYYFFGGGGG